MTPDREARETIAMLDGKIAANHRKLSAATEKMTTLRERRTELEGDLQRAIDETGDVDSEEVRAATEALRQDEREFEEAENRYRACDAVQQRLEQKRRGLLLSP